MKKTGATFTLCRFVAWALVLATLLHLGWHAKADVRWLAGMALHRHREPVALPCAEPDALAAQCPDGNVLLKVVGPVNPDAANLSIRCMPGEEDFYLSAWYFRLNYEFYPRRVWLAPTPTNIINTGWDVMRSRFTPDENWLQEHDVRSVVVLGFDDQGKALPAKKTSLDFALRPTAGKNGGAE